MEKLKIITINDNETYLRQKSKEVKLDDSELCNNIKILQKYCMENDVLAMAAIQLGIPKRIVYVKNTDLEIVNKRTTEEGRAETEDYNEAKVLINPIIVSKEGLTTYWEACASCKGFAGKVKRPYRIKVKYLDMDGNEIEEYFEGFGTTVLCHEIDHLDGILHIDIADKVVEATKEQRIELRKNDGYNILSKTGVYDKLKEKSYLREDEER